jgi:Arc/MetJ-type ribon-helix-helix transcriptional regulator
MRGVNMQDMSVSIKCPVNLVEKIHLLVDSGEYMNMSDACRGLWRLGLEKKGEGN